MGNNNGGNRLSDPEGRKNDGTLIQDPQTLVWRTVKEHAFQEAAIKSAREGLNRFYKDLQNDPETLREFLRPLLQSW